MENKNAGQCKPGLDSPSFEHMEKHSGGLLEARVRANVDTHSASTVWTIPIDLDTRVSQALGFG